MYVCVCVYIISNGNERELRRAKYFEFIDLNVRVDFGYSTLRIQSKRNNNNNNNTKKKTATIYNNLVHWHPRIHGNKRAPFFFFHSYYIHHHYSTYWNQNNRFFTTQGLMRMILCSFFFSLLVLLFPFGNKINARNLKNHHFILLFFPQCKVHRLFVYDVHSHLQKKTKKKQ